MNGVCIGDHGHVRFGNVRQIRDFTRRITAHFCHNDLIRGIGREQAHGQADVVVEVLGGLMDSVLRLQTVGCDPACGRFAH